jgi:hypothetical protein
MIKDNDVTAIYKKLAEFQEIVPPIDKNGKIPNYRQGYATLDNIQITIKPFLNKVGLYYTQAIRSEGISTTLFDKDGNILYELYPVDIHSIANIQQQGSAITYIKRYSLVSILGLIVCNEDDDGTLGKIDGVFKGNSQPKPQPNKNNLPNNEDIYNSVQPSFNKSNLPNDEIPCWLDEKQLNVMLQSYTADNLRDNLSNLGKVITDGPNAGKTYKMRKEFKTRIENKISELNNL